MIKKKNVLLVICSFTFLLCVFALLFSVGKPLSAAGEDLFEEENGISMDAALPESAGTDDPRKGVLLTAAASGTKFTFSDTFAGRFVLDFRAFSEETYNSPINSGNSYVNNYADFEEMMITFTDKNDETNRFSIVIAAGSAENYVTPNVSVAYGDAKAGIYYDENVQNSVNNWTTWSGRNQTKAKNALGYYTYLSGSSFCNKAYYGYQFAAPKSTVLSFDPATMQVSAYAYDAERVWGERLILDLDAGLNDHLETPVLKGFAQYDVEITLNAVKEGKTAKVLLYSLNGQSLDGAEFSDDAAPNLYADLKGVAEKGARFDLFPAYIYDVIDGVSAFSGSIVADIDGYEQTVLSENGMPYLVPDRSGNLTVRFKAGDAAGNRAELVKQVAVKDGIFEIGCEIKTLPSGTYGTGERFYLNKIAFDEEYRNVLSPLVTLSDGTGKAVGGIDEIPFTEPVEYVFETAGEYVLTISAAGFADTLVYEYTVTDAEVAFVFSEEFAENYAQGDRLTLPAVTAGKDGKEVAAALTVTAPSGESFSVKDFLYLTEYGRYTLTYAAVLDGARYEKTCEIFVSQTENDFTSSTVTETKNAVSAYFDDVKGTLLTPKGSSGERTEYNRPVDLSAFRGDLLLKFYSTAASVASGVFPTITLTDIHDAQNFITITVSRNLDGTYGKFVSLVEYAVRGGAKTFSAQTMYAPAGSSPSGQEGAAFRLFYDWDDNAIYANYWSDRNEQYVCYLNDLYPQWQGFTTGEVSVSLTLNRPMLITDLGGYAFGGESPRDRVAPVINVHTGEYTAYPDAAAGRAYPLFAASAYDETDGKCEVKTAVYSDYDSPNKKIISVDPVSFTPPSEGVYTVEYTAADRSGNVAVKRMTITAKAPSSFAPLSMELSGEVVREGLVGKEIEIPQIRSAGGGTGSISTEILLTLPSGGTLPVSSAFIPEESGSYTLDYVLKDYIGQTETFSYPIEVKVENKPILENVELPFRYALSGAEVNFPACAATQYVNGKMESIPVKIELTLGDNAPVVLENDFSYTPEIPVGSVAEMKVRYFAENAYGTSELPEMSVTVVNPYTDDTGRFDMKKYFAVKENTEITSDSAWAYLRFGFDEDTEISFVNKLLAQRISAQFAVPTDSMDSVIFTLTDSLDSDISVQLKYHKREGDTQKSDFQVNNGPMYAVNGGFGGTNNLSVAYSNATFLITDGGNTVIAQVADTVNGEAFNGFTSGYAYLKIETVGAQAGSELRIVRLNGQNFSSITNVSRPIAEYKTDFPIESDLVLGDTLRVPSVQVNSVLFGIRNVTVTVTANGKVVAEKQPADREYSFPITQDDRCRVVYEAETYFGKSITVATFYTSIVEYEPPVITVEKAPPSEANVGDRITLSNAVAKDNISGEGTLYPSAITDSEKNRLTVVCQLFVIAPDLSVTQLYSDNLSFVAEEKGTYRIRYYAYDENHNFAIAEYEIAVS